MDIICCHGAFTATDSVDLPTAACSLPVRSPSGHCERPTVPVSLATSAAQRREGTTPIRRGVARVRTTAASLLPLPLAAASLTCLRWGSSVREPSYKHCCWRSGNGRSVRLRRLLSHRRLTLQLVPRWAQRYLIHIYSYSRLDRTCGWILHVNTHAT